MARPTKAQIQQVDNLHREGLRRCNTCEQVLPVSSFGKGQGRHGLRPHCKPCTNQKNKDLKAERIDEHREYMRNYMRAYHPSEEVQQRDRQRRRDYYEANRDKWSGEYALRAKARQYRITPEELTSLRQKPCVLCGTTEDICVDHCHDCNTVRGPLCRACNSAIGRFGDDPARLQAAIEYLESHLCLPDTSGGGGAL